MTWRRWIARVLFRLVAAAVVVRGAIDNDFPLAVCGLCVLVAMSIEEDK